MSEFALIGIDLGKHTFHLHDQNKPGRELFRKKRSRQLMMRFFSTPRSLCWGALRRARADGNGAPG